MRKRKEPILKDPIVKDDIIEAIAVPAYERFADLIAPTTRLALPEKFQLLQRIQHAMDSIVQIQHDRDQPAVFHRIKKAAENIIGR